MHNKQTEAVQWIYDTFEKLINQETDEQAGMKQILGQMLASPQLLELTTAKMNAMLSRLEKIQELSFGVEHKQRLYPIERDLNTQISYKKINSYKKFISKLLVEHDLLDGHRIGDCKLLGDIYLEGVSKQVSREERNSPEYAKAMVLAVVAWKYKDRISAKKIVKEWAEHKGGSLEDLIKYCDTPQGLKPRSF
jgi:hypothetical protein